MIDRDKLVFAIFLVIVFLPRLLLPDAFTQLDESRWLERSEGALAALREGRFSETGSLGYPAVPLMATIGSTLVVYRNITGQTGPVDSWPTETQHHVLVWARVALGLITGVLSVLLYYLLKRLPLFERNALAAAAVTAAIVNEPWLLGLSRITVVDGYVSFFLLLSLAAAAVARAESDERFTIASGIAFGLGFITKSTISFFGPFMLLFFLFRPFKKTVHQISMWLAGALGAVFLFWPAMWVHPIARLSELLFWDRYHAETLHEPMYWPGFHPPFVLLVLSLPAFLGLVVYVVYRARDFYQRSSRPGLLMSDIALLMGIAFQIVMAWAVADRSRWILPSIMLFAVVGNVGLWRALQEWVSGRTAGVIIGGASLVTVAFWAPYYTLAVNPLFYTKQAGWQLGMGEGSREVGAYVSALPNKPVPVSIMPNIIAGYVTSPSIEVIRFPKSDKISEVPDNATHLVLAVGRNRVLFEPTIKQVYDWMDAHTPEYVFTFRGVSTLAVYSFSSSQ